VVFTSGLGLGAETRWFRPRLPLRVTGINGIVGAVPWSLSAACSADVALAITVLAWALVNDLAPDGSAAKACA
jgi:hypothetical protein